MLYKRLSPSEYRMLLAIPYSLTYSEVARRSRLSLSYVNVKVKELSQNVKVRFWADYRAMGLSPTYLLAEYEDRAYRLMASRAIPFVKRILKVWGWDGAYLLISACPPLGFERRFAYYLPLRIKEIWVKEWEAKWIPSEGGLTKYVDGRIEVAWEKLHSTASQPRFKWGIRTPVKVDWLDLMIIREKEEYAYARLSSVARKVKTSQQLVSYHYRRHVRSLWIANYLEPLLTMKSNLLVLYRLEAIDASYSLSLLYALSQIPWLIDAFALQGEERIVIAFLAIPQEQLVKFHSAMVSLEGVLKAELLAYIDPASGIHYGFTAHLGFERGSWSLETLESWNP